MQAPGPCPRLPELNCILRSLGTYSHSSLLSSALVFLFLFINGRVGLPRDSAENNLLQCRSHRRHRFDPWVGKIPWRRAWLPTPIFLPGESHEQRSMAGYSPEGCKELDTTEVTEHIPSGYLLALASGLITVNLNLISF